MSNCSRLNPHGVVPKEASAHNEARAGSGSLPIKVIKTMASSNAAVSARQEKTVFRNVTRFCRVVELTKPEAVLLIA